VYTRGLSEETRATRLGEIDSDLHEHRTTGAHGAAIVGRTLRGVPADVSWWREERRTVEASHGRLTGVRALWATATQTWFAPFAMLVALFNVLLAVWVVTDRNSKMPGQAIGPVIVLSLTAALLVGLVLRWRAGQSPPAVAPPVGTASGSPGSTFGRRIGLGLVAVLAVAAVIFGAMTSFFLFGAGVLTLAGVGVVARRRGRLVQARAPKRSAAAEHVVLADVLIIIGTLPALGMWWLIIPGVLALLVIGGVIGTGPGTRRRAAY
jgi:hypothetical protein